MSDDWQQFALQDLLTESLKEQRRRRRWGIFFKLTFLTIFVVILVFLLNGEKQVDVKKPHTALIDIKGIIAPGASADADRIATSLHHAFKDKGTRGIILRINSPGGSPVQSDYIYNEIMRLRAKYPKIKVYAVCSDICASAAYFIASAANKIYSDPASLVGSIGVIMSGFGFVGSMEKLGVSRRTLIAGDQKAFMDPFAPLKPLEVKEAQKMLGVIHQQFIDAVEKGRGARLKPDPNIFSGRFWTGEQAKKLGLVDGFGSTGWVARNVIKQKKIIDYTIRPNYFEQFARRFGAQVGTSFANAIGLNQSVTLR